MKMWDNDLVKPSTAPFVYILNCMIKFLIWNAFLAVWTHFARLQNIWQLKSDSLSLGNVKFIFDQRKNLDYKILYNMLTHDLNYLELKNLIFRNPGTFVPGLSGLVEVVKKLIEFPNLSSNKNKTMKP